MKNNIQLTHREHRRSNIKYPLNLIANDMTDPLNVGSLFRLCDALGIEKLFLCGDTAVPPNTKINRTSRSTEKHVAYQYCESASQLISALKESGATIVSLEITSSSLAIMSDEFASAIDNKQPLYLILGAENNGVSEALLSLSDVSVHIPMHGNNSSMNVISAASIASYEILKNMQMKNLQRLSEIKTETE